VRAQRADVGRTTIDLHVSGGISVECALIASAIAGIITVVVYVLGAKTRNLYTNASTATHRPQPIDPMVGAGGG
jgi:Flp pilus assembly pilin Flp